MINKNNNTVLNNEVEEFEESFMLNLTEYVSRYIQEAADVVCDRESGIETSCAVIHFKEDSYSFDIIDQPIDGKTRFDNIPILRLAEIYKRPAEEYVVIFEAWHYEYPDDNYDELMKRICRGYMEGFCFAYRKLPLIDQRITELTREQFDVLKDIEGHLLVKSNGFEPIMVLGSKSNVFEY